MSLNSSVEDNNNQVTELRDLYTQLNRMVENLILRIADQERRLNTMTQKVGNSTQLDQFGNAMTPRHLPSSNSLAFNNLSSMPVANSLHSLTLNQNHKMSSLPNIYHASSKSMPGASNSSIRNMRGGDPQNIAQSLQEQMNHMRAKYPPAGKNRNFALGGFQH